MTILIWVPMIQQDQIAKIDRNCRRIYDHSKRKPMKIIKFNQMSIMCRTYC